MPTHVVPLQPGAPITWLMVHATAPVVGVNSDQGRCVALTVDSPSKEKLAEAMSPAGNLFEGNTLGYINDSTDSQTHSWLHAEMMAPMGQNFAGTLTNFHQHWSDFKSSRLTIVNLQSALKVLKNKGWITQTNLMAACQFVM